MTTVTLAGETVTLTGDLPAVGSQIKDFTLVNNELTEMSLANYKGKNIVLNIFPSIDTGICALSAKTFNLQASKLDNTVVLCISKDLPFALGRFCAAEGIENVETLSAFRSDFGTDFGILLKTGALAGLLARSVIVVNSDGKIIYTQLVPEIKTEPDYQAAIDALTK